MEIYITYSGRLISIAEGSDDIHGPMRIKQLLCFRIFKSIEIGRNTLIKFVVSDIPFIDKSVSRIVESFKSCDGLLWNFQLRYVLFEESTVNEILKMHSIVSSHDNDIVWMGSKNGSLHVSLSIRLLVESKEVREYVSMFDRWVSPPFKVIELNSDASIKDGLATLGFVVRNSQGEILGFGVSCINLYIVEVAEF
ncbi:hypothetical protein FEM48_Zijuj08G0160500 [Ziziphus jujuba var. spinosa]|uniref:Uncharacterized protein n=1 Tax=Ziziphus jujuba var. spinosa TaxID=714518 RepID=A0A978V017_ZIZJJ|nr:hypothetical protein FEM48_Zijuj08G0160500 [Ziziphus jujuba var. spinosa]